MNFDRYDRFAETVAEIMWRIVKVALALFALVLFFFSAGLLAVGFWRFGQEMFSG